MKKSAVFRSLTLLLLALILLEGHSVARAADGTVRAVLFYSPSCGHCHYVIEEVLTPLVDQYGDQLQIVGINISEPTGRAIYQATIDEMAIPETRTGVPTLIIGETVLVGSAEIPEEFPGMVADYMAEGGIEWPNVPGLDALLAESGLTANDPEPTAPVVEPTAVAEALPEAIAEPAAAEALPPVLALDAVSTETMWDRAARDPVGNGLSILVLLGMIGALVLAGVRLWRVGADALAFADWPTWKSWGIAALCVAGLGVSAYMAYVETTETAAVCGPVGDCNTVQQSEYAALFGVLPIGFLGLVGYGALLFSWAGVQWGQGSIRRTAALSLLGLALAGTLFSIYLTFLEPFVIGATCAWCLTSALVMTLILLLSLPPKPAPAANPVPQVEAQA